MICCSPNNKIKSYASWMIRDQLLPEQADQWSCMLVVTPSEDDRSKRQRKTEICCFPDNQIKSTDPSKTRDLLFPEQPDRKRSARLSLSSRRVVFSANSFARTSIPNMLERLVRCTNDLAATTVLHAPLTQANSLGNFRHSDTS